MTEVVASPSLAPAEPSRPFEFDEAFQCKIAAIALRDTVFNQKTDGLVRPEYFINATDALLVDIVQQFYTTYKKVPEASTLGTVLKDAITARKLRPDTVKEIKERLPLLMKADITDREFLVDKIATFAKHRAMEEAILASVHSLEKGDFASIETKIRKALMVGANDDATAYDYFAEIDNRTEHRVAVAAGTIKHDSITTGIPELDAALYHGGWGRKELAAFMARAKFGKSMALGDFGKNASLAGHPTLILSCEVSARIYADRLDANFGDTAMRLLKDKPFDVKRAVQAAAAKAAPLKIHDFAAGTLKPSQIRRILERYRTFGINFDLIIVDYADICAPENYSGNPIEDSKNIWLGLRAIAHENNSAVLTATQTNREGAKKSTAAATDVAEDYNKVRIADLLIAGNATEEEIALGQARLNFAASRNQAEINLTIKQDREKMKFLTKVLAKAVAT